jgi:23S rRNA pseudouridine1911/1915/1917 synthase
MTRNGSPVCLVSVTVDRVNAGQRLDRFLAALGACGTRSQVQRLITSGLVRIDGQETKASALLRCGQRVDVAAPSEEPPASAAPEAIPLHVLYEDELLLVVDKPPGLVVHPAPGNWRGTLVNAVLHHWQGRPADLDPLRPGIVHRLDKDTSGVLVVAKDAGTLAELARQFRSREVTKEYLAVAWGSFRQRRGEIRAPIARHPVQRRRMSVRSRGREAITRYEVVGGSEVATLVRLFPQTGRTHQLRVHLASIGHAIVGDRVYGNRAARGLETCRHALHAASIVVRHPATGQPLRVAAPPPPDFTALLQQLGLSRLTSRRALSTVLTQHAPDPSGSEHARLGRPLHRASPNRI